MSVKGDDESTLKMNLEAAKETARQIRLRNLSGIILIDFINQDEEKNEETLLKEFRYFLAKDPIQTTLVDITALGLAEVTRKKVRKPLHEAVRDRIADAFAGRDNRGDANIMSKKELKTNAMRILDRNKIPMNMKPMSVMNLSMESQQQIKSVFRTNRYIRRL